MAVKLRTQQDFVKHKNACTTKIRRADFVRNRNKKEKTVQSGWEKAGNVFTERSSGRKENIGAAGLLL